jgi:3,4-dehydroadipyl-CoA semialdehyde dehydrogenase
MIQLESYLCDRWQAGGGTQTALHNPATEEVLAQASSNGLDLGAALRHARERGGPALRALGFRRRGELLQALAGALHARREELIELAIRNGGNTRGDAKFDIDGAIGTLSYYATLAKELPEGNVLPDGPGIALGRSPRFSGQHICLPRPGVAVHVNAFNFPAWGMMEKLACSLLAGVPALCKPGTPSALLAWRIGQLVVESGALPAGSFQLLVGGAGDLLAHLGPQDTLAFTGSSKTGAQLRAHPRVVEQGVRVNIEADSVNAAVLAPDVEVSSETYAQFLALVALDMTQKAGQKCTAVRRIFVPQERLEDVAAELVAALARVVVGDPAASGTTMGPVASAAQLGAVREGIERLARDGKALCGGAQAVHARGYFVAPTLLRAPDARSASFHAHEVFGPVASLLPYSGRAAEAAELIALGQGGLVASVYANDTAWTEELVLASAPWVGRLWLCSDRAASQATQPGMVLPQTIHGGPGRAGGGEELGGLRGLAPYLQRTAVQGFQGFLAASFSARAEAPV